MSKNVGKRSQHQNDFLQPGTPVNLVVTNIGTARTFDDGAADISFNLPDGSPEATSFTVVAYKNGVEDFTVNVTPPSVPGTPPAPTVRSVVGETRDYVTIIAPEFTGGLTITQYNWESSDGKSGNRDAAGEFTVDQEANTSQTYRVRAVNSLGASPYSPNSQSITTSPPFFPPYFPPYFPPSFGSGGCDCCGFNGCGYCYVRDAQGNILGCDD